MQSLKIIISFSILSFLFSQESYNANLIGNWFEPNENYWPDIISDFNDAWGYEDENGIKQVTYEINYENITEVLVGLIHRFAPPATSSL